LKLAIGENSQYEKQIELGKSKKADFRYWMKVIPVSFSLEHKAMLAHSKMLLERGLIAIDKIYPESRA